MTDSHPPHCPLGDQHCPIYSELEQLRQSVAELAEQVRSDALTGLYNKRHLMASLETEMERTCRTLQATSLIMLDVDHFKAVNDTHGHLAGDKVLQSVARIIKSAIRKIDVACRYGGEEFAMILPSTPLLTAVHVAERVREFIAESPVGVGELKLPITVSIGVSSYLATQNASIEKLLDRADKQLYRAKTSGRNQVCAEPLSATASSSISEEEKNALFNDRNSSDH